MHRSKALLGVALAMSLLLAWLALGPTTNVLSQAILWLHCGGVGPILDEDWCGCTWGTVHYNGRPVADAQITLSFGAGAVVTNTAMQDWECFPYYGLSAYHLGAMRHDILTVTVDYDGQVVSRVIRALPDSNEEQRVSLVLPGKDPPRWTHYTGTVLARVLALQDTTLWEGTPIGARSWDLDYGCMTEYDPGLVSTNTQAIAVTPEHHVWVGTTDGVAEYGSGSWQVHDPPSDSSDIRAIAVNPTSGCVYVGADGVADGGVSCYDGATWYSLPDFNGSRSNSVRSLWVDAAGDLWIGTDGAGVTRCQIDLDCCTTYTCTTYTTDQGLASNVVYAISEEGNGIMWFGTGFYITAYGAKGGASRYDLLANDWTTYTHTLGLASTDVTAVTIDPLGRKWFGTWGSGISVLDDRQIPETWITHSTDNGLPSDNMRSLAIEDDGTAWAGTDVGIGRYRDPAVVVTPVIAIEAIAPSPAVQWQDVVSFTASSQRTAGGIRGYEWTSDRDGPLSTVEDFYLGAEYLSAGTHTIYFRVLDKDGHWSLPVSATLVVEKSKLFLPLVMKE